MPRFDVLAVGELNPDLILAGIRAEAPLLGSEQEFGEYRLTLGSSTAIACVLMQRLGLSTALVARIGADEYGRFCRQALIAEGIDVAGVAELPGVATGVTISLPYPQDRLLLTCYGTMDRMTADAVTRDMLADTRHLHSGSFFIQRALRPGLAELFEHARTLGVTTSLDTGWDPDGTWMGDDLRAVLAHTDMFFPNETEFAHLTDGKDFDAGMDQLHALGVGEVVLKLGNKGSLYSGPEGQVEHSGYPVTAIDTTGAGDACNAGYISARLRGLSPRERLRFANACGAITVTALGGTGGLNSSAQAEALITAHA